MSKEAMQLALEALKQIDEAMPFPVAKLAQAALREALVEQPAQPEPCCGKYAACQKACTPRGRWLAQQEPVAWVDLIKEADEIVRGKVLWKRFIDGTPLANDIACWMADFAQRYTSPPAQRSWVGLTDAEIESLVAEFRDVPITLSFAIEAKLKEKNT